MAIFKNRPLAASCCFFILTVTVLSFLFSATVGIVLTLTAALAGFAAAFLLWRFGYSYKMLCVLLLMVGILLGGVRFLIEEKGSRALRQTVGTTQTVTFTVEEVLSTNSFSSELLVKVVGLGEESCHGRAILIADFSSPFYRGDRVTGRFEVESLTYGNYYENQHYQYRGEGCSVVLVSRTTQDLVLLEHTKNAMLSAIENLRFSLCDKILLALGDESGSVLNAMLLGMRDGIAAKTTQSFKRAGVMHLLAISGLHIGILAALCERLICFLGVQKRIRVFITLLLLFGYLIITGCTPSILRAVLMMALVFLAFFFKNRADSLTSLFVAAAVILIWHPYAVFSTSYQLTVLATFGILAFERVQRSLFSFLAKNHGRFGVLSRPLGAIATSLLISFFAGFAILPVQWLTFGEIATITPLSNLLLIPLAAPFLLLGLAALLLYPLPPFAFLARGLGSLILWLVKLLATPNTVISLVFDFVPYVLIPCMVVGIVFLIVDLGKRRWLAFSPMVALVFLFAVCLAVRSACNADKLIGLYRADGKNESVAFLGNDGALLCDISSGSSTQLGTGWQLLQDAGATDLDVLLLTHYHKAQCVALSRFCERVVVRELWIPKPRSEEELAVLEGLFEVAKSEGVTVKLYTFGSDLTVFGTGKLSISEPLFMKRSVEPAFAFTLNFGGTSFYYESASMSEYRRELELDRPAVFANYYILGAHGPIPHDRIELPSGEIGTVLVPNETALALFEVREGCQYIAFPEKYRFLLQ